MRKKGLLTIMLASMFMLTGCEKLDLFWGSEPGSNPTTETDNDTKPTGDGLFSVSPTLKVRFAPGNLVYTDGVGYSFAPNQYDYGGYFGWGTGSNPNNTSTNYADYQTFNDWGNYISGGWRTLSIDEWEYLLNERHGKKGVSIVCGVHGMVLLPDNWSGGEFSVGFDGWNANYYDAESWKEMEESGAVFLPASGYRIGTDMGDVGTEAIYWSSTPDGARYAHQVNFTDYYVGGHYSYSERQFGISVRLVQNY